MTQSDTPRDDLYRGVFTPDAVAVRTDDPATDTAATTMYGHFTVFDTWYRIQSWFEGDFLERTVPGAFAKTIAENRRSMRVAFDHGYDPQIGDKPLGPIVELREDTVGVYYEVPLLDTDYNRDQLVPLLTGRLLDGTETGSQLGASFRMRVLQDTWAVEPGRSDHNPDGLPERTITEARVYEFGPVVYPANPEATAAARSLTDHYQERRLARCGTTRRAIDRLSISNGEQPPDGTARPEITEPREHSDIPHTSRPRYAAPVRKGFA